MIFDEAVKSALSILALVQGMKLENVPRVPTDLVSRWGATYHAVEIVTNHAATFHYQGLLSHEQIDELKVLRAKVSPFYFHTRNVEKSGALIQDALKAYVELLPICMQLSPAATVAIVERDIYYPELVVMAALDPRYNCAHLCRNMRAVVTKAVTSLAARLFAELDMVGLEMELEHWLTCEVQVWWRQRCGLKKVPSISFWDQCTEFPLLRRLYKFVAKCKSSSADAERMFAMHSQQVTAARASLGEAGVRDQLLLHSYLNMDRNQAGVLYPQPSDPIGSEALEAFLQTIVTMHKRQNAASLKAGDVVDVWFYPEGDIKLRSSMRQLHYTANLQSKKADGNWNVMWEIIRNKN